MIFKKIYYDYKELKQETEYYTRECWVKQEQIRKLKKENKELREEIEKLKKRRIKNEKTITKD